jgi:sec-independent protein translocase protein TatB
MLDIGFSEIVLISVLGLVVLGPEKLPRVAAQVGRWMGRARGMARQFREQLEEEVNLEEARKTKPPVMTRTQPLPPSAATPVASDESSPSIPAASPAAEPPAEALQPPPSQPSSQPQPHAEAEQLQPVYPDHYSHAHPTDSLGRPLETSVAEPTPGQHDWVSGVTAPHAIDESKADQTTPAAAYAPSHERGT